MGNKVELVILAAGMSTRFGGMKQIAPLDDRNHAMMDYAIYDAFVTKFSAVTFIIRKECREIIQKTLGDKISKYIEVKYVYQDMNDLPKGFTVPEGREKPWGTGQALLECKGIVNNPFVIINCDDYYNRNVFEVLYNFLKDVDLTKKEYAMVGYNVSSTISKNGKVNRGVCAINNGVLESVLETYQIEEIDGSIVGRIGSRESDLVTINKDTKVSMNVWGLTPSIYEILEKQFVEFLSSNPGLKDEFGLPNIINKAIQEKEVKTYVLEASNVWFGMTYQSDMDEVKQKVKELVDSGMYPEKLLD